MTWNQIRNLLHGVAVEVTWWAVRPLFALIDRSKEKA